MMLLTEGQEEHLKKIIKSLENELLPDREEVYKLMSKPYSRRLEELISNQRNLTSEEEQAYAKGMDELFIDTGEKMLD